MADYTPSKDVTLYCNPQTTAAISMAVLNELGIEGNRVHLEVGTGTRTPDFLKINPNGRIPALVHEGAHIWEASAITIYLGETFGVEAGLWPPAGPQRGDALKWVAWGSASLQPVASRLSEALPADAPGATEAASQDYGKTECESAALKEARQMMDGLLQVLDGALEGREHLVGGRHTLADTHVAMLVGWVSMMGTELAPYKNLQAWHKKCFARPALSSV